MKIQSPTKTRFCLRRHGKDRCFLSIDEKRTGDLIIDFRARDRCRELGHMPDEPLAVANHGKSIDQYRVSFHPSEGSNSVSTIKTTLEISGEEARTAVLYTSAVKENSGFCHIISKRCCDVDGSIYDFNSKKSKVISVGDVEDDFMLCYQVLVGPRNMKFAAPESAYFSYKQRRFEKFSIVVIFTFLSITMHITGFTRTYASKLGSTPLWGLKEDECLRRFWITMEQIRNECIETIRKDPSVGLYIKLVEGSRFFKSGTYGPDFENWWHSIGGDQIRAMAGIRRQRHGYA